ncbi:MAG: VWA domain-containing protein [Candidatus Colwellbacteria bacterium]|nr:VWA domain-containing protein [Candidatus Colwellbacteria bacterium]
MLNQLRVLDNLIRAQLASLANTDFSQVKYDSLGLALGAGLFLIFILVFKLLWGRNKFQHAYSGDTIPKEYHQPLSKRVVRIVPGVFLAASSGFLLLALANPYLPRTKIETSVESLEIVYLIDVSTSKGWPFENTGKSAGEITRQAHIKFLEMRRGQNDRAALWIFSTNAHKVEDFIIDDDLFMMQVEDAPYVMTSYNNQCLPESDPQDYSLDVIAPREKVRLVNGEGGTNLVGGLQAVIKYFAQEGRKNLKRKALILETDAAIEADPAKEFAELKKNKIVPYGIFIRPNISGEIRGCGGTPSYDPVIMSHQLKDRVKQYGGKVFDVQDKRSLDLAYAEVNKLETAPVNIIRHLLKVLLFQRPLVVALMLALLGALLYSIIQVLWGEYP